MAGVTSVAGMSNHPSPAVDALIYNHQPSPSPKPREKKAFGGLSVTMTEIDSSAQMEYQNGIQDFAKRGAWKVSSST
jgi:hypothetical protein